MRATFLRVSPVGEAHGVGAGLDAERKRLAVLEAKGSPSLSSGGGINCGQLGCQGNPCLGVNLAVRLSLRGRAEA